MKATLLFTFLCSGLIFAQDNPNTPATPEAKTKIEQFISKKGRVLIKTFEDVFEIPYYWSSGDKRSGAKNGDVAVWEITDATSKSKIHGVKISLNVYNRLDVIGQRSVFLDADEIESVIKGIDYLLSYDGGDTKYEDWQVDFKSKAGLKIIKFSTESKSNCAIQVPGGENVFLPEDALRELKSGFIKAQKLIGQQ